MDGCFEGIERDMLGHGEQSTGTVMRICRMRSTLLKGNYVLYRGGSRAESSGMFVVCTRYNKIASVGCMGGAI